MLLTCVSPKAVLLGAVRLAKALALSGVGRGGLRSLLLHRAQQRGGGGWGTGVSEVAGHTGSWAGAGGCPREEGPSWCGCCLGSRV